MAYFENKLIQNKWIVCNTIQNISDSIFYCYFLVVPQDCQTTFYKEIYSYWTPCSMSISNEVMRPINKIRSYSNTQLWHNYYQFYSKPINKYIDFKQIVQDHNLSDLSKLQREWQTLGHSPLAVNTSILPLLYKEKQTTVFSGIFQQSWVIWTPS